MLPPQERRGGTIVSVRCVVEVKGEERPALVTDWSEIFYTAQAPKSAPTPRAEPMRMRRIVGGTVRLARQLEYRE